MNDYLLSLLIFLPLAAAGLIALWPGGKPGLFKWINLGVTAVVLLLAGTMFFMLKKGKQAPAGIDDLSSFQFLQKTEWFGIDMGGFGKISVEYLLGIDGLNAPMLLLSAIVLLAGSVASFGIKTKEKAYHALYLLTAGSVMGCFAALDFFLFFVFFEFMLLPMYFLIGIWGGERREYASIKFFLYTLLGSVLILLVMIALYSSAIDPYKTAVSAGFTESGSPFTAEMMKRTQTALQNGEIAGKDLVRTFNLVFMADAKNFIPDSVLGFGKQGLILDQNPRLLAFLLLLLGFAIKLPAIPLHTWLPDAHVEAPTPVSILLAGILLKIGGYGLMRTAYTVFPEGAVYFAWWIALFGMIAILYAALVAIGTHHLKRMIAYSSISHMGFVLLGLASLTVEGTIGAVYQMFSHGLISAMLFFLAGVLYDRSKNMIIDNYKGLFSPMPRYSLFVGLAFFASLGLPGFSGFIAEILVFFGAFKAESAHGLIPSWMAVVSTLGLLLGATYLLWTMQRMFFGPFRLAKSLNSFSFHDLTRREFALLFCLSALILFFGIFPQWLTDVCVSSSDRFVQLVLEAGKANLEKILSQTL